MKTFVYAGKEVIRGESEIRYAESCLERIKHNISVFVLTNQEEQRKITLEFAQKNGIPIVEHSDLDFANLIADYFVLFWDGKDKEMRDVIINLRASGKKTEVFFYSPTQ